MRSRWNNLSMAGWKRVVVFPPKIAMGEVKLPPWMKKVIKLSLRAKRSNLRDCFVAIAPRNDFLKATGWGNPAPLFAEDGVMEYWK